MPLNQHNKNTLNFKWGIKNLNSKNHTYKSFSLNGVEYFIADNVYLYSAYTAEAYVGKLVNMWESSSQEKKIRVVWFFRPREIRGFLSDYEPRWNELFLASGDNECVSGVAPLESVSGKCRVLCTSNDKRNPLPSDSALRKADFVFSHVFDVQSYTLSERFPDAIYNKQVEFFFNKNAEKSIHSNLNIGRREEASETNLLSDKELGKSAANAGTSGSASSQPTDSGNTEDLSRRDDRLAVASQSKKLKIKIKKYGSQDGHEAKMNNEDLQKPSSESQPVKRRKLLENAYDDAEEEDAIPVLPKEEQLENPSDSQDGKLGYRDEITKADLVVGTRTLAEDIEALEYALVKDTTMKSIVAATMRKPDNDLGPRKGTSGREKLSPEIGETSCDKNTQNARDKDAMENKDVVLYRRPEKLADIVILHAGHEVNDLKAPACARDKEAKIKRNVQEVTKRPSADKKKWFDEQPWEARMKNAHEQGALVWFNNLDPSYTSTEVEDIIWSAFEVRADAKVIHPRFFSPYHGQAFAIFKTKGVADTIILKLRNGCLMIDGRPLVARRRTPKECGKPGSFPGHIAIDKIRMKQREEKRNAISTSHCSQSNTFEFELALDWLALRAKADLWWKTLHEGQANDISECLFRLKALTKNQETPVV